MASAASGDRLRARIVLPVTIATLVAIAAAALGLYQAAARSDTIAIDRQLRETRHVIHSGLDEIALVQESIAIWDLSVRELRKAAPDWDWFDENIGIWLHTLFGHDQVWILGPDDAPLYGVIDGVRAQPSDYAIAADLKHLIDTVRGRVPDRNNVHERLPGTPLPPQSTVRTTEAAIHATELTTVAGRPAAASVMMMKELNETAPVDPAIQPLAIGVRYLDGRFLEELSKRNMIDSPRFSRTPFLDSREHAWTLTSEHDESLGYFIWRPELPGTALMRAVAPTAVFAIGLMIVIMALLARSLYRSMRAQQHTILELRASEAQAHHMAFHDTLTGLANRARLYERLDKALPAVTPDRRVAVLLLDLDRFKNVNDTLGHLAGDALIKEFASRLERLLDEDDMIARLGGDEFVILRCDAANDRQVEALCERIMRAVRQPFDLLGNSAFVGVSIGVAIAPDAGRERIDLLRKADIALYRAKAEGRDRYCLFTASMDDNVKRRGIIEEELRAALATGEGLRVHYQPQIAGADGAIIGLEALVRWQHPKLGLIAPDQFIAVAEGAGLIVPLGEWVLRQACLASRRWPELFIAVNLSPAQFRVAGFAERVIAIVRETGANERQIELEVTEGVLLDDSDAVCQALATLRGAGFRIALDDFGTGYSSLSYLRQFQVDKIKIDRSFVQHLNDAPDAAAIISAVLTLGHAMGLSVTAEGVETTEQERFLAAAGCDTMQGFLFFRPLPEEDIDRLITAREVARGAA